MYLTQQAFEVPKDNESLPAGMSDRDIRALARFRMHKDHPWFTHLNYNAQKRDTGLHGYYGSEICLGGVILAKDVKSRDPNQAAYKMFAYFNDKEAAVDYILSIPEGKRHFYELIGGVTEFQAPYFDLDIPNTENPSAVLSYTVVVIELILEEFYLRQRRPLTVYQTNYPVDPETGLPKKFSFHVVAHEITMNSSAEMMELGNRVIEYLEKHEMPCYVDKIWNKTRQFRMLGSSKIDSEAVKIKSYPSGRDLPLRRQILESFVSF